MAQPKKQTLNELRIEVFKREMTRVGYNVKAFKKVEIERMAKDAFRSWDGKKLKSYGTEFKIIGDNIVTDKVKGQIRNRQREQIKGFKMAKMGEVPMSFGQQIAISNVNAAFGYDIFKFIEDNEITDYDISNMTYVDPKTGMLMSFVGVM